MVVSLCVCVCCFSAYIEDANIKPYFKFKNELVNANKTSAFKDAVVQIEEYITNKEVSRENGRDGPVDPRLTLFDALLILVRSSPISNPTTRTPSSTSCETPRQINPRTEGTAGRVTRYTPTNYLQKLHDSYKNSIVQQQKYIFIFFNFLTNCSRKFLPI